MSCCGPSKRDHQSAADSSSPTVNSNLDLQTNYGRADGTVNIGQGTSFDTAPLSGKLNLNVANLEVFRNFLPVNRPLKGRLNAAVNLARPSERSATERPD